MWVTRANHVSHYVLLPRVFISRKLKSGTELTWMQELQCRYLNCQLNCWFWYRSSFLLTLQDLSPFFLRLMLKLKYLIVVDIYWILITVGHVVLYPPCIVCVHLFHTHTQKSLLPLVHFPSAHNCWVCASPWKFFKLEMQSRALLRVAETQSLELFPLPPQTASAERWSQELEPGIKSG